MAFCKSCGAMLKPGAKFCTGCGVATGKIAGGRDGITNRFRRYASVGGVILLALISGVIISSFYLDIKSVDSELIMSSGADNEHNTQLTVPAKNSTAPKISENDFELIEETRLGVFFLSSNQRRGVLAEKLFSQSKNHCLRQFSSRSEMDSCIILYVRPESRMGIASFEDRLRNLSSLWLRDDFVAIYTLDPDNSTERRRPDELFVIDCNFFPRALRLNGLFANPHPKTR